MMKDTTMPAEKEMDLVAVKENFLNNSPEYNLD